MRLRNSAPPTKPFIALAISSFILALSQSSGANPSVNTPQSSINTVAVEQSLNTQSQFDASESNQTNSAAAILSAATVVGILSLMKGKNSSKPSSTAPRSSSRHSSKSQESNIRLEQASRKLQNKLLRLLHNDRGAASRLLSHVKMKNPNRSTNWCVEKVIYDLQRDHGRW